MRAKPDMKPWVNTYKTKKSSDEERHFRRKYLSLGVPPLIGAQWMCGVRLTQGLRPGLCGSIALTGLIYVFPIIFWCACSGTISKIYSSSLLLELETIAECGNRKALRLKAQGVYSCKWRGLNVDNNAASAAQWNGLTYFSFDLDVCNQLSRLTQYSNPIRR